MNNKMNDLEIALLDKTGVSVDLYLEDVGTMDFMQHVEEIKQKSRLSTDAGKLREDILKVLDITKT